MDDEKSIPVYHYGNLIGKAAISETGVVEMDLQTPEGEEFGDDLKQALDRGYVKALEIRPITPKGSGQTIYPPMGTQYGNGNVQHNRF